MKTGFTLIELSIVLVIIGLIVGGIIVGGDLIKAAEYRASLSQLKEYDTAVRTFQAKYQCLPGDCDSAVNFGIGQTGGAGDNGNGNGHLGSTTGTAFTDIVEDFQFWVHLSNAGFIKRPDRLYDTSLGLTPPKAVMPTLALQNSQIAVCYECFILTPADEFIAWHYFLAGRLGSDNGSAFYQAASLKPTDLLAMDTKIDDGLPMTGGITPSSSDSGDVFEVCPFCSVVTNCIDITTTPYIYNIANDNVACSMSMRAGF